LCTINILHGSKACKKSCKPVLVRFLQVLEWLWPFLLQFARFWASIQDFLVRSCQNLLQAVLHGSCKNLVYGW
jgi:hypothetical protein